MDNDHRVLAVVEHLGAWRTAAHRKARFTLELAAGEVERRGIAAGDQLLILPQDPAHPEQQAAPRRARRARRADDARAADAAASAAAAPAGGAGGAPQSMTVLVASADRRFRAVASSLLERRGWRVLVGEEPTQAAQLARLWSADVIVLDTDHSEAAPTQIAAQIGASAPEVGVVLVGEATESRVGQPLVQPKWGVFDELAAVIEDAYWRRGAHKLSA
jgi:CheY-like chemotaxis protein